MRAPHPPNQTRQPRTIAANCCRFLDVKVNGPNLYLIFQSARHNVFHGGTGSDRQFAAAPGAPPRSGLDEEKSAVGILGFDVRSAHIRFALRPMQGRTAV
jgi:hypothetical protein